MLTILPQEQQEQVTQLRTKLPLFREDLAEVARAEDDCKAANVDENDYTVFTCQDLEFELELLEQSITKKIAFIDNQVCTFTVYGACSPDGRLDRSCRAT